MGWFSDILRERAAKIDGPAIREHSEGHPAQVTEDLDCGRLVIEALNEGGHNGTSVDLLDVLDWAEAHPEVIAEARRRNT